MSGDRASPPPPHPGVHPQGTGHARTWEKAQWASHGGGLRRHHPAHTVISDPRPPDLGAVSSAGRASASAASCRGLRCRRSRRILGVLVAVSYLYLVLFCFLKFNFRIMHERMPFPRKPPLVSHTAPFPSGVWAQMRLEGSFVKKTC